MNLLLSLCDKSYIVQVMLIVKTVFKLLCYLAPLIIIIISSIHIFKIVMNGKEDDLKDALKVTVKRIIAGLIIFFLPAMINYVFTSLIKGNEVDFIACFESASKEKVEKLKAKEQAEEEAKKKAQEKEDEKLLREAYEAEQKQKGAKKESFEEWKRRHTGMDFSCTSETVKANFSCNTLEIVEKHLYDLNAQNFYDVINSYGGFENYAKSVGGIFGEYYGKTIEGRTEKDFQTAAEYVLGWMFMYGWDYASAHEDASGTSGEHAPWGLTKYTPDAFYVNGGYKRKFKPDYPGNYLKQPDNTDFDHIISGMNGVDGMASECGDIVGFTYKKLGLKTKKRIAKITRLRDLKVGDSVGYSNDNGGGHMNMVGEVYDDHIVFYDAGRYMQGHLDYKRPVYFPKEDSKAADDAVILKEYGMTFWEGSRWYNFE